MAEPAQPSLSEQRVHGGEASAFKDLGIGHSVAPYNTEDAA